MGYQAALEANNVIVKHFKEFGDYQGTWVAVLEDGRVAQGSYGSCSGCDAFQAEFGWDDQEDDNYQERLKTFGASYLIDLETKEEIIARYERKCDDEWSWEDDKEILTWLKQLD